jgi:hypothetical protein
VSRDSSQRKTKKSPVLKKDFLDATALIRSIQRAEGNPDCFRRGQLGCEEVDCTWRKYCLEEAEAPSAVDFSRKREKATEAKQGEAEWPEKNDSA